jgi:PAS domain S-box-containing protein
MSQPMDTAGTGSIQELRQAQTLIQELSELLQSQREALRQRGMNLPPMVQSELGTIRSGLGKVEHALVEEQTELGQLRALADMSARITTSLDVDTVLNDAMDIVIALTRAERGYIILGDPETGDYEFRVSRDDTLKPGMAQSGTIPQISTTVLSHVLSTREPLLADNAFNDKRFEGGASVANFALRSVLCVPLNYRDDVLGAVYVDNRLQSGIFSDREKNTLAAFANTATVAIANAKLYEEIRAALEQITQVKDLMDNVFRSIASGLIATDAADVITTFNHAAEEILAVSAADTFGHPLAAVLPKITSDLSDHLLAIREQMGSETLEAELSRPDGERVAVNFKLSPLRDVQHTIQGVAIVLDDVTEKREREQQLRILKTYLPPEMVDQIHEISQLALGGVRRQVTCMFAEVRPLYTMKDVRPAEMMDLLNRFLAVATSCIHDTHGIIDKYMGTEVMALWNTQLSPREDHARWALECGLLMRDRFLELYQRLGIQPEPHYYRIGMHTGVATMGNVGSISRRDFTAIGDTINLSKRLEENAARGQVIISEDSMRHLQQFSADTLDSIRFEGLPAIQVKGREQKTQIYEVFRQNG